jgi:hypothetical protein
VSLASWWKYGRRTGTSVNGQQDYPEPVHSFLETVLKRLFKYYDIVGKDEGGGNALYLRRFILRWGNGQKGHIFLHHIYRSDSDRYPHSHPWAFKTLVLSGGYTDESYDVHWTLGPPTRDAVDKAQVYRWPVVRSSEPRRTQAIPGHLYYRPRTHVHLLKLPEGETAWTLVKTSGRVQPWGFLTEKQWVYWREYLNDWTSEPG